MLKLTNILVWISIALGLIAWSGWTFYGREWFEIGQALTVFFLSLAFFISQRNWLSSRVLLVLTSNQLSDELFFNPFEVSWNEFITVFVLILLTLYTFYKAKLKRKN